MTATHGDCIGRKLLILGDVNTGKTTLARALLEDLCHRGLGPRIAVADFAPRIPAALARAKGLAGVGGDLRPPTGAGVRYLADHLDPPRLSSATDTEAAAKARANLHVIERLLQEFDAEPRDILFVNDVTLYLQAGTADGLIARLARADTVVANGYRGERLGAGELTRRERAETDRLAAWFATVGEVVELPARRVD